MRWQKGWYTTGLLGIMVFCITSTQPVAWMVATAQAQSASVNAQCQDEPRGQILALLTRDLIYRSHQYIQTAQFDLATRTLERALQLMPTAIDPFQKVELVANIAGTSGGQPSTMEQLVKRAIATRQHDSLLALLPKVVQATQALDGEYGVINGKREMLIQLARYYTRLNRPDQARPLLAQARQLLNSLPGDGFGLIAAPVAEGYAALGENQPAIAILKQAWQRTEAMKTNNLDYLADIFRAIAIAYTKANAAPQAIQVAQRIKVARVKATTLALIVSHAAATNPLPQANSLLAEALKLTQTIPTNARSDVLFQIAIAYAQMGQWDRALPLVKQITTAETRIRTLAKLASISHRTNRTDITTKVLRDIAAVTTTMNPFYDGDRVLREMFTEYLTQQQYELALQFSQTLDGTLQDQLLLQLIEQASIAGALKLAHQGLTILPSGWENQTRYSGLRFLATGYAQAGQYDQAIQLLPQIKDTPNYPNHALTWIAIAQSYRENGQTALAIAQLNQALQALQSVNYTPEKLQAMLQIAGQLTQLGERERAIAVQTEVLDLAKAGTPNVPATAYWVEQLITHYLKVESYDLALQLVQTLTDQFTHDRHLQTILQQMLEVGDWSAVGQLTTAIRNPHQKIAFWIKTADYYRGMGQDKRAIDLLAQAFTIAQTLTGPDNNDQSAAHQIDPSIPPADEFDRGSLLAAIAIRYAELGQADTARQTAQALRSPTDQQKLLQRLMCYQYSRS